MEKKSKIANKLYFRNGDDSCYSVASHREYMIENNLKELKIYRAKRETQSGYFFCKFYDEVGESGYGCGKVCNEYKPRNGKSGICKHSGNVYEQTEEFIILTNTKNLKK